MMIILLLKPKEHTKIKKNRTFFDQLGPCLSLSCYGAESNAAAALVGGLLTVYKNTKNMKITA